MTAVRASEVVEFQTAVAGVEIDWVRTDEGFGEASMVSSGDQRICVSTGGLDFSTLMNSQIPADRLALQLVTSAPSGLSWCGSEADDMEVRAFGPTTSVFGNVPAGSRAVTVVAWLDPLAEISSDLRLGDLDIPSRPDALPETAQMRGLARDLMIAAAQPGLVDIEAGATRLLETVAHALATIDNSAGTAPTRRFSSRDIVTTCLDYVESTGVHQPAISELCAVAFASETRLRQAFVEMLGVPPVQYFAYRVLSQLRNDLLRANPDELTVTRAATSLGLTQLGRVAGRYRALFGETPSETLNGGSPRS